MGYKINHLDSPDIERGEPTSEGYNSNAEIPLNDPQHSSSTNISHALDHDSKFVDNCNTSSKDARGRTVEANRPLFVPQFPKLRHRYRERIRSKLQQLEDALPEDKLTDNSLDDDKKFDEAARLLRQYDECIKDDIFQMVDLPALAQEHDLSIIHFEHKEAPSNRSQRWVMISKTIGNQSKTFLETSYEGLRLHEQDLLTDFIKTRTSPTLQHDGKRLPYDEGEKLQILNQRSRTTTEKLYGTVCYDEKKGTFHISPLVAMLWKWVLWLIVMVLILGYGTCVVGANVEFSGGMKRYFFVIALVASLILSVMFSWLIWVLGGAMRDVTTSFISFSALSLVVLQVAQTHLIAQQQKAI